MKVVTTLARRLSSNRISFSFQEFSLKLALQEGDVKLPIYRIVEDGRDILIGVSRKYRDCGITALRRRDCYDAVQARLPRGLLVLERRGKISIRHVERAAGTVECNATERVVLAAL